MTSVGRGRGGGELVRGPGYHGVPGGGVAGGREAWLRQLQDSYEKKATGEATPQDDAAREAAKKATYVLNHKMTRYEKMQPDKVLRCLKTANRLFSQALLHPKEPKPYHQVRAANKALSNSLLEVPGGEELLLAARWHPTTIEHEKYFVFDRNEEHSFEVLRAVGDCVRKALELAERREERMEAEKASQRNQKEYLEEVQRQIEADKVARKVRFRYATTS